MTCMTIAWKTSPDRAAGVTMGIPPRALQPPPPCLRHMSSRRAALRTAAAAVFYSTGRTCLGCSPEVRRVTAPWCLRWRATDLGARVVAAASNPISSSSSPPSAEEPLFLFGVDNDEDEMIQRFWRLWAGNAHCRHTVTHSPRGSIFRDSDAIEAAVRRLHRYLGPMVDVPKAFMREPELLRVTAEEVVRRTVALKTSLPFLDGRAFHLAP
eukprot:CAMPEP_0181372840 /NCGR_PEP_ID=MMETSP1106-20121128/15003_1 /TAXON_ID=81844 /ORGANISM="Mantoniella antarctica, Strain SL-175" /LENGTH=210 /DNA_ID=CAMNT_0023490385 /DNA_START=240 /DNA_END=868 /DNA_ORIENTATION=+